MDEGPFDDHLTVHLNPRDSIFLSALTLCVPGIIYNLEKYRQIECMYADCMQTYAAQGLPLTSCGEQKSYGTCKYVVGELFQFTPAALLDRFAGLIKQALSSPFGFVDITMGLACSGLIVIPHNGVLANMCILNNIIGLSTDVGEDLFGKDNIFKDDRWKLQNDYCDGLDEQANEQENE